MLRRRRVSKPLKQLAREELEWYWFTHIGRSGTVYLLLACTMSLATSVFTSYVLTQPIVVYDGIILHGYVSPLSYDLRVLETPVVIPPLDSANSVAIIMLFFNALAAFTSILGFIGVFKKWRTWVSFVASSTAIASLLVTLLYSLLRLLSRDIIPIIPYIVTVQSVGGGRVYLNPPRAQYSWIYYLPWRPLYFFIAYNILVALTAGTLVILLLRPKAPVTRVEPRKLKAIKQKLVKAN